MKVCFISLARSVYISNKITFTFTGTDSNNIAGFECSLDASAFSSCTTPKTYGNLGIGEHIFKVRAIDSLGNKDNTPASFSWKVLTPAQGIRKLIDDIDNNQSIVKNVKVALIARLQMALKLLTDSNPKNDVAICGIMVGFSKAVDTYNRLGLLTLFQTSQLKQQASAIKNSLGCPANSSPTLTATTGSKSEALTTNSTSKRPSVEPTRNQTPDILRLPR